MPIVTAMGIPKKTANKKLVDLKKEIKHIVASIPELKLEEKDVTVLFPPDLLQEDLGKEIILTVIGLFDKPTRTDKVRKRLADNLMRIVKLKYFNNSLVECLVYPFDPEQGFATSAEM